MLSGQGIDARRYLRSRVFRSPGLCGILETDMLFYEAHIADLVVDREYCDRIFEDLFGRRFLRGCASAMRLLSI
jgi:hypothetical protein